MSVLSPSLAKPMAALSLNKTPVIFRSRSPSLSERSRTPEYIYGYDDAVPANQLDPIWMQQEGDRNVDRSSDHTKSKDISVGPDSMITEPAG